MQIHWFSIINSCVTVLLLTGFLATILMRVLKNDFIKYTRDDEIGGAAWHSRLMTQKTLYTMCEKGSLIAAAEEQEEIGWKYIHGDVFRPPPHLNLFCACVGTGMGRSLCSGYSCP